MKKIEKYTIIVLYALTGFLVSGLVATTLAIAHVNNIAYCPFC
jgi:hypothetical protein